MRHVKFVLIACSLCAAAVVHAQTTQPAANAPQQSTQAEGSQAAAAAYASGVAVPEHRNACVGPASFCNIYFGN
jgi:hypothetical protein